ncbi:cyclin-domain-containing protein [Hyaloscypha hepaticicola]|uniref:Cyclin-domain-containing protein n=1 Tax=Hyaloscypha hepaticicola TaxID=2082293 RepID=A0A2J6PIU2_9HELO|nr:cyclin-domain-containing protein [Hyaloscypha hepaticicola]
MDPHRREPVPVEAPAPEQPPVPAPLTVAPVPSSPTKPLLQPESPAMKRRLSQDVPTAVVGNGQPLATKRAKSDENSVKVLPSKYEFCPVEDLVVIISLMISELIETNDQLPLRNGVLTRFHSRTSPGISVLDYLNRLAKHATLTPPLLLSMVYYIDRLCLLYPAFTITTLTVHRFLITAATVAAKGLSDSFWNNATYARVGGIKIAELGLLELDFLYRLDWKIVPNPETLVDYYRGLVDRAPGYVIEDEGTSSSSGDEDEDEDGESPEEVANLATENTDIQWKKWMDDIPAFNARHIKMKFLPILAAIFVLPFAASSELIDSTTVYIQSVGSSATPVIPLAEIKYNPSTLSAELASFDFPELDREAKLLRVGVYDVSTSSWKSSTSTTSAESFGKGYSPTLVLSLDAQGGVIGISLKSAKIDAGQTRDFGPKVKVLKTAKAPTPALNRAVVLSPEGKLEEPIVEKTMLQKYWWVILAGVILLMSAGGGE